MQVSEINQDIENHVDHDERIEKLSRDELEE